MSRAGWYLPSYNSPIITMDWLSKVRFEEIWCPKRSQLRKEVACYSYPSKDILYEKIYAGLKKEMRRHGLTPKQKDAIAGLGFSLSARAPNVEWMVDVLAILNPKDEIFKKSYMYVRPKETSKIEPVMNNTDGLYDNLPPLSESALRKTNRLQMPKVEREKIAQRKLERAKAQLVKREEVFNNP